MFSCHYLKLFIAHHFVNSIKINQKLLFILRMPCKWPIMKLNALFFLFLSLNPLLQANRTPPPPPPPPKRALLKIEKPAATFLPQNHPEKNQLLSQLWGPKEECGNERERKRGFLPFLSSFLGHFLYHKLSFSPSFPWRKTRTEMNVNSSTKARAKSSRPS